MKLTKTRKVDLQQMIIYIGTVVVFLIFTVLCAATGRNFLTWTTISNIIVQTSIIAILASGTSFIIITGGIDLSIGSVVGFALMVMAVAMKAGLPLIVGIIIALVIGAIFGVINGALISYAKLPAFVATLGTMSIGRGGALAMTSGKSLSGFAPALGKIASTTIAGIPIFVFYVAIIYIVFIFISKKTKYGRYIYAIGGNRNAAKLSGINVAKYETLTYVIAGVLGGIAAIMLLSRLVYAAPTSGDGYEMDCIAAAVIGGVSLSGGQGKVFNTLFGALILGILKCGLQMMNISTFFQQIATGVVIIAAVYFDRIKDRKAE